MRMAIIVITAMLLGASPALAHKVNVHAHIEGSTVKAEAYYADGARCKGCGLTATEAATGKAIASAKLDSEGRASFEYTGASDLKIKVDAGGGHAGHFTLRQDAAASALLSRDLKSMGLLTGPACGQTGNKQSPCMSPEETAALVNSIVEARTSAIMNELSRLREASEKPRVTEIIGGIGYIAGLAGLYFWIAGRKRG